MFLAFESRAFAGGAAWHQKIDAAFDLPAQESAQRFLVKPAARTEWRH
jgi:hypothetical protein